jgi:hypothetical protein
MHVVVATHGHCFDGLCSAVAFTHLRRSLGEPAPSFSYVACGYGVGQRGATDAVLLGDENAILDYRFTASERVSWYFDHRTAFASDGDRAFFDRHEKGGRYFFDAGYGSCTKLVADVARERFGVDTGPLAPLVEWADRIDSASFDSAEQACDQSSPLMRFASVVEHHGNDDFLKRFVPKLLEKPLSTIATLKEIERRHQPIGERQLRFRKAVEERARLHDRVVVVDLTDRPIDLLGKFITYALFPRAVYSVVAAKVKRGYKIAVGYNPWCGQRIDRDISAICARYGGGGHRAVGGISMPDDRHDEVQRAITEITNELGAAAGDRATPLG